MSVLLAWSPANAAEWAAAVGLSRITGAGLRWVPAADAVTIDGSYQAELVGTDLRAAIAACQQSVSVDRNAWVPAPLRGDWPDDDTPTAEYVAALGAEGAATGQHEAGEWRTSPWLVRAGRSTLRGIYRDAWTAATMCDWRALLTLPTWEVEHRALGSASLLNEAWRTPPAAVGGMSAGAPIGLVWLALLALAPLRHRHGRWPGWESRTSLVTLAWSLPLGADELAHTVWRSPATTTTTERALRSRGVVGAWRTQRARRHGEPHSGALGSIGVPIEYAEVEDAWVTTADEITHAEDVAARLADAASLMDATEVAEALGITPASLRAMRAADRGAAAGMPPPLRQVQDRPVWRRCDVEAWLAQR